MRRLAALFVATLALAAPQAEINGLLEEVSRITGFKPLRPIQHAVINKAELKRYLERRMKEVVKPDELRAEELTLKKFGFVPADFDLRATTVDLLTEQAAAFYDFHKRKLFLLDTAGGATEEAALVHELAHALADQYFNLGRFIERGQKSDDGALARAAVMEGQASWVMAEFGARRMGGSLKDSPAMAELMAKGGDISSGQFPVLEKAPLYIRESLLFPYTRGMLFQQRVIEKMGQAGFAEVFRHPPSSTAQIIHPERYFARVAAVAPPLPEPASPRAYRRLAEGSLGEFDHAVLLRQYAGEKEAQAIAPRGRGGAYRLLEHKTRRHAVLAYASEWDDAAAAREYFRLYRGVLGKKWKTMEVNSDAAGALGGRGDDGWFLLRLDGARVWALQGMQSPDELPDVN